ncbi:hypothetical protein EJB05_35302, partial [Eragrostis curvula]
MRGRHYATVIIVLLAIAATAAARRTKYECDPGDRATLLAVKAAFGNASYFQSWTPDFPCCKWIGAWCDESASPYTLRRIVALSFLRDDSLVGPLPGDAIAGLTALRQLILIHVPGVNGTIPRALTRIPSLSWIDIEYTGMSGPVPSFLSELTALSYLRLAFSAFTGEIPASLADLPNLSFLDLGRNHLTGRIPQRLLSKASDAPWLTLCLSHNNLSGTIPAEFAAVNFWTFDLSHNAFTGDASLLFGLNKSLSTLNLSRNAFSFNLSAVQLPNQLVSLDLSHNDIYGVLPPQVVNMQSLNVSYNRLSGTVPTGGSMHCTTRACAELRFLPANDHRLHETSSPPAVLGKSFLCELTGLTDLGLPFNSFMGTIPESLADLPNLSYLDLGRNHLTAHWPHPATAPQQ